MYIIFIEEKCWIQQCIELVVGKVSFILEEKKCFFSELIVVEGLECYFGVKFLGVKCFLLEGGDVLILMFKEMICYVGKSGICEVVLGMVYCGCLNVLVNVLGKKLQDLFDEFVGKYKEYFGIGDVKYYMGFFFDMEIEGGLVYLVLVFNLLYFEIVSLVVIGFVCVCLDCLDELSSNKVLFIIIYGDVVVIGQGVVQEILNMFKVCGYEVGGIVCIVINN